MIRVTYVEASGTQHTVEIAPGLSLMEGAVTNNVPGILADCGGACACGTCRVYVESAWRDKIGEPSDMEEAMLELYGDPTTGKRLACQIKIREALDGLVVRMPASQY
jgi:ferredoxin, 2Fe-2S